MFWTNCCKNCKTPREGSIRKLRAGASKQSTEWVLTRNRGRWPGPRRFRFASASSSSSAPSPRTAPSPVLHIRLGPIRRTLTGRLSFQCLHVPRRSESYQLQMTSTMPTPMLLILLKLMLETLEMFKLSEKFHITHTQLENNGPDNQPTDSFNILMDPTQSIFTNPTVPIPTEITKPHKLRVQLFQKSNKDGNPKVTLTTGLKKLWLDNKDGLMRSTHGLRNSPSDKMICQKLTPLTPV